MTFKISDTGLVLDTISISTAEKIDAAWVHSGMPNYGMRIYGLRAPGNGTRTFLGIPGDDYAPRYELKDDRYVRVSGPTLAEYQEYHDMLDNATEDRALYDWATGH